MAITRFHKPMLDGIRALPGVEGAGLISRIPLQEYGNNGNFTVAGKTYPNKAAEPFAEIGVVSPGYFAIMGIPVLRGRDVAESDVAKGRQVVLINDATARKYFRDQDPIGQEITIGQPGPTNPLAAIVGIVGNVRQARIEDVPLTEVYIPYGQSDGSLGEMALMIRAAHDPLMIRAAHDPGSAVPAAQSVIRTIDPTPTLR